MAEINIPSMFDTQYAIDRQSIEDARAMAATGDPSRNLMTYNTMRSGDLYNQGLMGLAGLMGGAPSPQMAKQQALEEVFQQFGNPETPEDAIAIADALRQRGLYSEGLQFMNFANEMRENIAEKEKEKEREKTTKEVSMDMAAEFVQCAIDAGGWRNADQACKAKVFEKYTALNRQTSDEVGNNALAREEAERMIPVQSAIYLQSDQSSDSIASIDQSISLLDEIYSGTSANSISGFKRLLVGLGIVDADVNAAEEMFVRNSMESVTAWIEQTKGSISDTEMQAFLDASPSLANTKAGNLLILKTMKEAANYYVRLESEFNDWKTKTQARGERPTETAWRIHKETWYRNGNKPKMPTVAEINAALEDDGNTNNVDQSVEDFKEEFKFTVSPN